MAKKTAKKAAPRKAPAKGGKATVKKKPAPAKTPKPKVAAKPPLDNEQLGYAAGAVWGLLHDGGPQTLAAVKKGVDHPTDVTLMAIGWLAREGKLDFVASGRGSKVSLR